MLCHRCLGKGDFGFFTCCWETLELLLKSLSNTSLLIQVNLCSFSGSCTINTVHLASTVHFQAGRTTRAFTSFYASLNSWFIQFYVTIYYTSFCKILHLKEAAIISWLLTCKQNECVQCKVTLRNYISLYLAIQWRKSLKTAVDTGESFPNYAFQDRAEIDLCSGSQGLAYFCIENHYMLCLV